ncbi:alpha/beta hydrolase [Kribbella sp. NPDC005582]|uniref:alpha/beta fold hydrolase n=1 Tax=Kribbella sp. NPDC005582 TaxID=3156893 RepID=UPI00339FB9B5
MLIDVRDTSLYVDQRGAADAPPLLFLHGGPGSGSYDFLSFQGDRLAERLHVIGVDQRGIQQSASDTGPISEHLLIADFEALREALGLESWSILGHSFGGRLALRYAVQHPKTVSKVIFENPAWDVVLNTDTLMRAALPLLPEGAVAPAHEGAATRQMWDERIEFVRELGDRRMEIYLGPDTQDLELPADTAFSDEVHARATHFYEELASSGDFFESLLPLLAQVDQPALLIKGGHDPVTSPEEIARFQADVPKGTYYLEATAGHFAHAEAADAYTRLVTDFVLS